MSLKMSAPLRDIGPHTRKERVGERSSVLRHIAATGFRGRGAHRGNCLYAMFVRKLLLRITRPRSIPPSRSPPGESKYM